MGRTLDNIYWVKYLFSLCGIIAFIGSLIDRKWGQAATMVPITAILWLSGYGIERLWLYAFFRITKRPEFPDNSK
jgi:hypothetical protein